MDPLHHTDSDGVYRRPLGEGRTASMRPSLAESASSTRRINSPSPSLASGAFSTVPTPASVLPEAMPLTPASIRSLMWMSKWREVIRLSDRILNTPVAAELHNFKPHELVQFRMCRVLAYYQLRDYKLAAEELDLLKVGEIDAQDSHHKFENYPAIYPNQKGSFLPFSARLLKSQLPGYQGQMQATLDLLHTLLAKCRREIQRLSSSPSSSSPNSLLDDIVVSHDPLQQVEEMVTGEYRPSQASLIVSFSITDVFDIVADPPATLKVWKQREVMVSMAIIGRFLTTKEYGVALMMVNDLRKEFPKDLTLLCGQIRIFLQIGNIPRAKELVQDLVHLFEEKPYEEDNWVLVEMCKGHLALAEDKESDAIRHFDAILQKRPFNYIAANNRAIALLFSCKLQEAIKSLEEIIDLDPAKNLNESIVFNLCILYELHSEASPSKKKNIISLIQKYGGESFDMSVVKLSN